MGNATLRQTPAGQNLDQDLRIFMQVDLPKFVTHSKIGNGKFMKTYLMRVESTQVIVKVYMRFPDEDLMSPARALTLLWNTIPPTKYPNLMPYQMWIRSTPKSKALPSPVYLIRQFFNANLYDRLSTRPFLNELEKHWIIFQLLKCLEICHEHGVVHGDIKPENIMCTTSNWLVLTDFSPFKPVMLPDDDLTDFKYYFDAMARDRCYIAQERFFRHNVERWNKQTPEPPTSRTGKKTTGASKPADVKPQLLPSMDVFSAGCVMAEIMMDGTPLFDLPGMLQYVSSPLDMLASPGTTYTDAGRRTGDSTPTTGNQSSGDHQHKSNTGSNGTDTNNNNSNTSSSATAASAITNSEEITAKQLLTRIRNPQLKAVIVSMTRKDADKRLSAADYLKILQGKIAVEEIAHQTSSTSTVTSTSSANVLPDYFESCIYPLYLKLHWNGVTPDDRVSIVCECFGDIVQQVCGSKDKEGTQFFAAAKSDAPLVLASLLSLENRAHEVMLPAVPLELRAQHQQKMARPRSEAERRALHAAQWRQHKDEGEHTGISKSRVRVSEESVLLLTPQERQQLSAGELLQLAKAQLQDLEALQQTQDQWEIRFLDISDTTDDNSNKESKEKKEKEAVLRLEEQLLDTLDLLQHALGSAHHPQRRFGFFSAPPPSTNTEPTDAGRVRPQREGLVLIVDIVCANYRHLKLLPSRALSILLLGRLGAQAPDGVILQRIVPVLLVATEDSAPTIRVLALRALAALTSLVRHIEPIEVGFFPQYVFHALSRLSKDNEPLVKLAFAECLGSIACTAKRFLVLGHRLHADKLLREATTNNNNNNCNNNSEKESGNNYGSSSSEAAINNTNETGTSQKQPQEWPAHIPLDFPYDSKLEQLKEQVSRWIRDLVMDSGSVGFGFSVHNSNTNSSNIYSNHATVNSNNSGLNNNNTLLGSVTTSETAVKKVLLAHVLELCEFFGQESTMDKLLTQLLTFLNDQDCELRELFCRQVANVGAFLGLSVTTEYIVPCLENVLYDVEEKVAVAALTALSSLVQTQLVAHYWLVDLAEKVRALLLHPSVGLREAAVSLFACIARAFGVLDTAALLLPGLRPVLHPSIAACVSHELPPVFHSSKSRATSDTFDDDHQTNNNNNNRNSSSRSNVSNSADTAESSATAAASLALAQAIQQPAQLRLALLRPVPLQSLHRELRLQLNSLSSPSNSNNTNDSNTLLLSEETLDETESQKLRLMDSYLSATAREVYTKSLRWRSAVQSQSALLLPPPITNTTNNTSQTPGSPSRTSPNPNINTNTASSNSNTVVTGRARSLGLLQWSATQTQLLDSHLLCLAAPTMKANVSVSEDLRRSNIYLDNDEERNLRKLRTLFLTNSIQNNNSANNTDGDDYYAEYNNNTNSNNYSNNVVVAGSSPELASSYVDTMNPANNNNSSNNNSNNNNNKMRTSAAGADSVTLLRRLRALQVPPVSVDLGTPLASAEELRLLGELNTMLALGLNLPPNALDALDLAALNLVAQQLNSNTNNSGSNSSANIAISNSNASSGAMNNNINNNMSNNSNSLLTSANNVAAATAIAAAVAAANNNNNNAGNIGSSGANGSGVGNSSNSNNMVRREREGVLVMTLREHSAAVNRLAVASDMSYFCSASSDGTVKVWQTRLLDRVAFPRSVGTYAGHGNAAVIDAVALENSHSVASCGKDGDVHVWRVDVSLNNSNNGNNQLNNAGGGEGGNSSNNGAIVTSAYVGSNQNNNSNPNNLINSASATNNGANNTNNSANLTGDFHFLQPNSNYAAATVRGATLLRVLQPEEGGVSALQHYHSDIASVVLCASQRGGVHAWDLRAPKEAFTFHLRPDLGILSALTVGPDRHWVAAGTSKGVIALWDVRFNVLSAAWRHSSGAAIQRLACCKAPRSVVPGLGYTEGAFLFCAAGNNEAAIFGLPEGGECAKCFRSVPMNESRGPSLPLPQLTPLHLTPLHHAAHLTIPNNTNNSTMPHHVVRAMLGRVSATNPSHLVTAGSDRVIRFWDFQQPTQCFTIAGSEMTQPRAQFRAVKTESVVSGGMTMSTAGTMSDSSTFSLNSNSSTNNTNAFNMNPMSPPTTTTTNKLLVCYTPTLPSPDKILQSQLPARENRGLGLPSVNSRDSILDLKDIELPQRLLLSSARDGEIKLWKVLL